jgi:hypothetical protein
MPAKKAARTKKAATKAKAERTDEKAEVIAMTKLQGRYVARNHEGYWLAAAHRTGLRQHPRHQRRREDRVVQERRG